MVASMGTEKSSNKYNQPTFLRVTHSGHDLGRNIVQGVIGVLKQLNVVFKSSDAVCCCVNVTFDVACVTWVFGFGGIRNGPITLPILWDETEGRIGGEVIQGGSCTRSPPNWHRGRCVEKSVRRGWMLKLKELLC